VIQHAQDTLGPDSPSVDRSANPEPAARALAADGLSDPTFEDLLAVGWDEKFARQVASVGADEGIPEKVRDTFTKVVIEDYFAGDFARANALWFADPNGPGTGFVPEPGSGKMPTGAQLRRYLAKINWNETVGAS
jgi:hypothetical protein